MTTRELRRGRPLPAIDADGRPFWDSCRAHAMALQRCDGCGATRFPPRAICPRCHGRTSRWVRAAGTGHVYASLVIAQAIDPAWKPDLPFSLALVELDEGVRMWGNVVGCDPDAVRIGDRVRIDYEDVTDEVTLPRFVCIEGDVSL